MQSSRQSVTDAWEEAGRSNLDVRKAIQILIDATLKARRAKLRQNEASALEEGVSHDSSG